MDQMYLARCEVRGLSMYMYKRRLVRKVVVRVTAGVPDDITNVEARGYPRSYIGVHADHFLCPA